MFNAHQSRIRKNEEKSWGRGAGQSLKHKIDYRLDQEHLVQRNIEIIKTRLNMIFSPKLPDYRIGGYRTPLLIRTP